MPQVDYIDVRIVANGQPLQEYADPTNEDGEDGASVYFVESVAGQRFGIHIKWLPGLKLHSAPYLYCKVQVDDSQIYQYMTQACMNLNHRRGVLAEKLCQDIKSCKFKDDQGIWRSCYFTFGALGITEENVPKDSLTSRRLGKLGRIQVTVFRAKQILRAVPYTYDGKMVEVLDEVPEKMLKGRHIKNNVKYDPSNTITTPPDVEYHSFVPMDGEAGKVTTIEFRYRNREILQHIGCIPRTPSPPPNHALMLERTEEMLRTEKEAKRKMNLEILRLRRELEQQKMRSSESNTTLIYDDLTEDDDEAIALTDRSESETEETVGVKRKRDDDDDDDDLQVMAPSPKKPSVLVDLTSSD